MKIVFYTTFLTVGGVQKITTEYLKILNDKKHEVSLIVEYDMGENDMLEFVPKNIPITFIKSPKICKLIHKIQMFGKKNEFTKVSFYSTVLILDYIYSFKIRKILKKNNYDVAVTFLQMLPAYITKEKNTKHIIFFHEPVEQIFTGFLGKFKFFKKIYLNKLKKYDRIVSTSEEMNGQLLKMYPELKNRAEVLYNPINFEETIKKSIEMPEENLKESTNDSYICSVARLNEKQKDFKTLINAYEKVIKNFKREEKLYIIGDGPDETELKKYVEEKEMEKYIIFLGKQMNPYVWVKKSKALVLSSKYEGLPTILLEGIALGVPIISSNCKTGIKEILENGKIGELFEVGNSDELAEKIVLILSNESLKNRYLDKYEDSLKRFDKEKIYKKFIEICGKE